MQKSNLEEALRTEIIETQKARSDLLKWKLLLIASVGSVGLGLSKMDANTIRIDAELVLCLLPFICSYVDLLCSNLNLRLIAIGVYFCQICQDPYEKFISSRRRIFSLEDWALYWSSILISVLVIIYAWTVSDYEEILSACGVAGVALVIVVQIFYKKHKNYIENESEKQLDNT